MYIHAVIMDFSTVCKWTLCECRGNFGILMISLHCAFARIFKVFKKITTVLILFGFSLIHTEEYT